MTGLAFDRFRFSFFENQESSREGLDIDALVALNGEDRSKAEEMLLDCLPDTRGVIGLGVLRSRRAETALVKIFEIQRGTDTDIAFIHVAKALWQIRANSRWLNAVIDILLVAHEPIRRQTAAAALKDFRDTAAVRALTKSLDDTEGLVRHHAARALLALHGLSNDSKDVQHMIYRIMSSDAHRREGGKVDILSAIAARRIE